MRYTSFHERIKQYLTEIQYSDLARLLNLYQLWLDDLYPRAKFADGLAIIEKLGHTKRIQVMRREWINEGKPRETYDDYLVPEKPNKDTPAPTQQVSFAAEKAATPKPAVAEDPDSDGLYSATPKAKRKQSESIFRKVDKNESLFISDDEAQPPDDDLDALLAEDDFSRNTRPSANPPLHSGINVSTYQDDFDDEEEAMADI